MSHADSKHLPDLRLLIYSEPDPKGPPVVVVTLGMSARRMNVPPDKGGLLSRAELIAYLPASEHAYTWWMQWLAEFPFIDNTWLGHGHTVAGMTPLFDNSALRHFLLLPSLVRQHRDMETRVSVDGEPVGLWWVVPITEAELRYKKANGIDALLGVFDAKGLPLVVDPRRASTV